MQSYYIWSVVSFILYSNYLTLQHFLNQHLSKIHFHSKVYFNISLLTKQLLYIILNFTIVLEHLNGLTSPYFLKIPWKINQFNCFFIQMPLYHPRTLTQWVFSLISSMWKHILYLYFFPSNLNLHKLSYLKQ